MLHGISKSYSIGCGAGNIGIFADILNWAFDNCREFTGNFPGKIRVVF